MAKFITLASDFVVREVVDAQIAVGFLSAPRPDIKPGDKLTEYEQMLCGLIPWDVALVPQEPTPPDAAGGDGA